MCGEVQSALWQIFYTFWRFPLLICVGEGADQSGGIEFDNSRHPGDTGEKAATPPGGQPAKNSSCWELFCCIWRHYALACEHQSYSIQHVFHEPIFWRHLPYIDDTLPTIWMNVISVPGAILSDRSCVVLLWSSQDLTLLCDTLHLWPSRHTLLPYQASPSVNLP